MSFSSNAESSKGAIGQFSTDFGNLVSEFNSSWNGPAFLSFSTNMSMIQTRISSVQQHFEIYGAVAELVAAIEIIIARLEKLIAYRATLDEPNPTLDAEIEKLEEEKRAKITSAVSMLNGITGNSVTTEALETATSVINSNPVSSATDLVAASKETIKLEPTCIEDINLGTGKYMTDADWEKSPYFSKEEFKCQCGGKYCNGYPVEISKTLVEDLNKIRFHYGKSITITSGIRCAQHNTNSGGARNSNHTKGRAVDIIIEGENADEVLKYIKSTYAIHNSDSYTGADSGYAQMDGVVHFGVKDIDR